MRRAVDVKPIIGKALQAGNFVTDFIIQNFRAAAGNGIQSGRAQPDDSFFNRQPADVGEVNDL